MRASCVFATSFVLLNTASISVPAEADEPTSSDTIVVTPGRRAEKRLEVDRSIDVITEQRRQELQGASVPELLEEAPGVLVQQSNRGAGAPMLRGLIGPQNLLMVDGIRFSLSTHRTGPNQYLSLFDPWAITRLEVLRGPSSVLHGNGAMGGVINLVTDLVDVADEPTGSYFGAFRTSSADASPMLSLRGTASGNGLLFLVGGSFSHFGLLRTGHDDTVPLSDFESGFWRAKLIYAPTLRWSITGAYFGGAVLGAGRTDTLNRGDFRRHDNVDHLAYVDFQWKGIGVVRKVHANVSYHQQIEAVGRTKCKTRKDAAEVNGKTVEVAVIADREACLAQDRAKAVTDVESYNDGVRSVSADVGLDLGFWNNRVRLSFGQDVSVDLVESTLAVANTADGFQRRDKARGNFSDDSRYVMTGTFAHLAITPLRTDLLELIVSGGARLSYFAAHAPAVPGFGDVDYDHVGVVGSAGIQLVLPGVLNVYTSFVQGFRAPNLQETTVLGDTGRAFELPNADLKPERSDTIEAGLKAAFGPIEVSAAYFYSFLRDTIDLGASTHKGAAKVDGKDVRIRVNTRGRSHGVEAGLGVKLWGATVRATVTWVDSELEDAAGNLRSAPKQPPVFGTASVRYDFGGKRRPYVEAFVRWAAPQTKLHPSDESDLRICESKQRPGWLMKDLGQPCEGTPGWAIVGVRGGSWLNRWLRADLSVSNIGDMGYRVHSSGFDAPGIDVRATLTADF